MKFSEFLDVRDGTHDSPKRVNVGKKLITTKNLEDNRIDFTNAKNISLNDFKRINERSRVDQFDILLSMIGTVGNVYQERSAFPDYAIKNLALLKFHGDELLSNWMNYYLQSKKGQSKIHQRLSGSTQQYISLTDLRNIEITLPNRDQMELCIKPLRYLDDLILKNNQINDNLISLAAALFNKYFPNINSGNEMIGNFISNYDRLRKPLSKKERLSIPGKYRYIGATSVNDYINKYNFDGIYLLLGEDGTVEDDNGYPILQYISGKFWPNNHAHVLQGKNVSTEWLYLFFKQRKITSIVTGAVQKKISQKNLNSLSISIPDKDKLARFNTIINPIFKNIRIIESENHSLEKIKIELLSKLF